MSNVATDLVGKRVTVYRTFDGYSSGTTSSWIQRFRGTVRVVALSVDTRGSLFHLLVEVDADYDGFRKGMLIQVPIDYAQSIVPDEDAP